MHRCERMGYSKVEGEEVHMQSMGPSAPVNKTELRSWEYRDEDLVMPNSEDNGCGKHDLLVVIVKRDSGLT